MLSGYSTNFYSSKSLKKYYQLYLNDQKFTNKTNFKFVRIIGSIKHQKADFIITEWLDKENWYQYTALRL